MKIKFRLLMMILLTCAISFTACDIDGKTKAAKLKEEQRLEEEKKLEEQKLMDIVHVFGDKPANDMLKKQVYKNSQHEIVFYEDTNVAGFIIDARRESIPNGIYTLNNSELIFDLSRSIHKDVTVEKYKKGFELAFKKLIQKLKEKLNKDGVLHAEKEKIEQSIKDCEAEIEAVMKTPSDHPHFLYVVKRIQQLSKDIEPINPIIGVLSADKKTLTLKKMLVKQNADGTAEYAENVVFTRE